MYSALAERRNKNGDKCTRHKEKPTLAELTHKWDFVCHNNDGSTYFP